MKGMSRTMVLIDILSCTDSEDIFYITYDNSIYFCGETKSFIYAKASKNLLLTTVKRIEPTKIITTHQNKTKTEAYGLHIYLAERPNEN